MNAWVLMLLPTALGVDFGWERQPDNSIEYIVQIEPEAVDEMKTGTELISSLPPQLRNIRNYRIRVGRERLPNQNILPPEVTSNTTAATNPAPATTAWGNSTQANNYQPNGSAPATYPPSTNSNTTGFATNNSGFVNSSLPARSGTNQFPNPAPSGTAPQYYAGTNPSNTGVSTSGFPMQNNTSTPYVPTNTGNYVPNVYAPPSGYGNPPSTNTGYANNNTQQPNYGAPPYNSPQYGAPNYSQTGYNPNGYVQPGYGPNGYPLNGQPQYMASNPSGANPNLPTDPNYYAQGPRLGDPQSYGMQTAKPSIEMPAPSGTPGYGPQYAGQNPNGFPNNQQFANNGQSQPGQNDPRFANTADPRTATDPNLQNAAATAKIGNVPNNDQQSQWASLTFSLIALFASLGANFYLGWTTYHLRERYRMILSDRTTY